MAGVREYFDKFSGNAITVARTLTLGAPDGETVDIVAQIHLDFDAPARYLSVFIPKNERWRELCQHLVCNPHSLLDARGGDTNVRLPAPANIYGGFHVYNGDRVEIRAAPLCEPPIADTSLPFTRTMFIYSENEAVQSDIDALRDFARGRDIRLRWRGPDFARERSRSEKPVAFISHDSRDKAEIARPLAIRLQQMFCPVWFDEFALRVGDSLREKIEKGLKECSTCILLLSPNFLSNQGWTKTEFNSVFTRELLMKESVILPVWCGVSASDVYDYSPSLANRVALAWALGTDEVARQLYNAISTKAALPTPSKWRGEGSERDR